MHRALYISEVLAEVIDHLESDKCFGTLADLAMTCQAVSFLSLSRLWAEVDFINFIELLGDALSLNHNLDEREESETRHVMCLNRALTAEEWSRLRVYAPFIRLLRFRHDDFTLYAIHRQIFSDFAFHKITFSSLRRLDWTPILQHVGIVHLLPHSLKQLHIHEAPPIFCIPSSASTPSAIDLFMGSLPLNCPDLEELDMGHSDVPLTPTIVSATLALQRLKNLSTPLMGKGTFDILTPLAARHTLLKLVIQLGSADTHLPVETPILFEELLYMGIIGPNSAVTQLLKNISCPNLRALSVHGRDSLVDPVGGIAMIRAVASSIGPQITSLYVRTFSPQTTGNISDLDPLRKFVDLKHLYIAMGYFYPTDDQFVQTLASWPLLQGVGFDASVYQPSSTIQQPVVLTLQGILTAANRCPNLRDLSVLFQAQALPSKIVQNEVQRFEQLALSPSVRSPVDDPQAVAHYLKAYGDAITLTQPNGKGKFTEKWRKVSELLNTTWKHHVAVQRIDPIQ